MNEPAFPVKQDVNGYVNQYSGMTLRDYFAAKAMQSYISKIPLQDSEGVLGAKVERKDNAKLQEDIAESAYWMADAMLKSRTEPKL